jgi:hypothetical protein
VVPPHFAAAYGRRGVSRPGNGGRPAGPTERASFDPALWSVFLGPGDHHFSAGGSLGSGVSGEGLHHRLQASISGAVLFRKLRESDMMLRCLDVYMSRLNDNR